MRFLLIFMAMVFIVGICSETPAHEVVGEGWRSVHQLAANQGGCQNVVAGTDVGQECVLCHTDGGSSSDLNAYALDIQTEQLDGDILWSLAIRHVDLDADTDSDGDGVLNRVEIREHCTFPGDATSVPVEGRTWSRIKALYR